MSKDSASGLLQRFSTGSLARWLSARWSQSGQSIVEMALFFPILLAVMVSVVEVGNALNSFITVDNAAREGARFGAAGGTDAGITEIVTSTMDLRLDVTTDSTDVFIIRGRTNVDGSAITTWTEVFAYGGAPPASSGVSSSTVLADLQSQGAVNAAGLDFVVAATHYDHESMLGVPLVANLSEMIPMSSYSIMQMQSLAAPEDTVGCTIYPIGIRQDVEAGLIAGMPFFFDIANPEEMVWLESSYVADDLAASMSHPGGLTDVHIGDWPLGYEMDTSLSGSMANLDAVMADHRDTGRTLLVAVFSGGASPYEIVGFITVRIGGYTITGDQFTYIAFVYGGQYTACGQEE